MAYFVVAANQRYRPKRTYRPHINYSAPLKWAPPVLTNPQTVTITDGAAHLITLSSGQDLMLNIQSVISDYTNLGYQDAMITITGGRNIVIIGGEIYTRPHVLTTLAADLAYSDTTIEVTSTAGYPTYGVLRLEGEAISYGSKDATHFLQCTRNSGYFNGTSYYTLGNTHYAGKTIDLAENNRSGISISHFTGTVHIEGLLIHGAQDGLYNNPYPSLNDGLRFNAASTNGTYIQIQNCRIGPNGPWDNAWSEDGHADCTQIIGGPQELRMDRCTYISAQSGRGLLNKGSDGGTPMVNAVLHDCEFIKPKPLYTGAGSIYNYDTATTWNLTNVWDLNQSGTSVAVNMSGYGMQAGNPNTIDQQFCPDGVPGLAYVSPGYLS